MINRYLKAGVCIEGVKRSSLEGLPQGGLLSSILSNIMLDCLDQELEKRELRFARYADDFVVFVRSETPRL